MSTYQKPRVSFLMKKSWRDKCFSQQDLEKIRSVADIEEKIYEELDEDKMKELIKGAEGILTCWGTPEITGEILDAADKLRIICHAAGTVKPYISDRAMKIIWDRDIAVTNTSVALGTGVAEFALGMIIVSVKKVFFMRDSIREGKWSEVRSMARDPFGLTVGVIGAGYCGRHLIKLLQNFEMEILVSDPNKSKKECEKMGAKKVELDYLMANSDVISLHAPDIPQTKNLINRERIKLIKDGAVFINTARGSEVDEKALIEELKKGRFYACLDVTLPEPPAADSPLRKMKNVFLTPHIAGHASNGMKRQGRDAAGELERFFRGEDLLYRIRKESFSIVA
jgi:phosphoglycerate dehydrogenase-like enzyme